MEVNRWIVVQLRSHYLARVTPEGAPAACLKDPVLPKLKRATGTKSHQKLKGTQAKRATETEVSEA